MVKKLLLVLVAAVFISGCTAKKIGSPAPEGAKGKTFNVKGLRAAVDLGLTLKCTYMANGATYDGYVKGKQWRGKASNSSDGVTEVIVQEDGCMYAWGEGIKQGTKMCFDPADMWEQDETMTDIEYKCVVTTVNDDIFTPPSDVTFIDPMNM